MMKKILVIVLALSVGGCAFLQKVETGIQTVTSASVSPKDALIAINSFDAIEATATNYNSLRRCTGSNGPICRDPAARVPIRKFVLAGRVARNDVKQYIRTHPGQDISIKSYQDLIDATNGLNLIIAQYRAG